MVSSDESGGAPCFDEDNNTIVFFFSYMYSVFSIFRCYNSIYKKNTSGFSIKLCLCRFNADCVRLRIICKASI